MMPLILAIMLGVSGTLLVWSLRGWLRARWDTDVAWLAHAVWRFTPEPFNARPYVAAYYIIAVLLLFGLLMIFRFPTNVAALVVWGVLLVVPKLLVERAWTKRRKLVDAQLPVAVLQVSSNVAAGMSLIQAVERVSERAPAPINSEFGIMANYWSLGADFSATMEEAKRRLRLENFNLFASALLINQTMGGNVVDTLDRLAHSLESIEHMQKDVYAATAEGRTNVKVLTIAPLIMLAFDALMDFEAVGWLFTRPVGHILLGIAVALTAAGTFWAWSIVNADV